jgi:hypothetical protein
MQSSQSAAGARAMPNGSKEDREEEEKGEGVPLRDSAVAESGEGTDGQPSALGTSPPAKVPHSTAALHPAITVRPQTLGRSAPSPPLLDY